jgi:hypothetical protein
MANKKSIGLPGGPNEYITDISEYLSIEGYKFNSPDVDNPFNIIDSGSITMQDVEFPVLGTDNLGNSQMMLPENDYQFPGDMVFEIPMAQKGNGEFRDFEGIPFLSSIAAGDFARHQHHNSRLADLYRYYSGRPLEDDILEVSNTKPTKAKDTNVKYISLNKNQQLVQEVIDNYNRVSTGNFYTNKTRPDLIMSADDNEIQLDTNNYKVTGYREVDDINDYQLNAIGNYFTGFGEDENGTYISYYDKFDQAGGLGGNANFGEKLGLTKPFEIYDRIYVEKDKDSGKYIQKKKGGGSVSWNWKGESYSGTLIPSMENEKNRYARTKNGKIKTLPKAQEGDETGQTEFKIDDRSGKINTTKGYDENKLFEFIKDKYKKVNTSTQKNDLVNKLSTPAFRERYKKNIFNISGENLSDEELTSRINSQIDFTAAGPDFHIKMPFVTNSPDSGYQRGTTPFISPFSNRQKLSYQGNQGLFQANNPEFFGDITDPDFPELTKYPYIVQLADKNDPYIMGDRDVVPFDAEGSTIVHEYAHSYNTPFSPLFKPAGIADEYGDGVINPNAYYEIDRGNYNSETERYDKKGSYEEIPAKRYKNWLSNLFGEDYFTDTKEAQPYGNWAMKPWEISSIRSQTEDKLKNANIWDNTKGEFNESNLNKMLRSNRYNSEGPETMHLDKLGYNELERINYNKKQINRKQERFNSGIDGNSSNYIMDNIIDTDGNRPVMKIDDFNIIFNNSQSSLRDNQKYSDFTSLVNDSKVGSRGKKKRANELLNKIYSDVKNELNQGYEAEKIELQKNFDIKKKEVLPKMKMYFNEIAMDDVNQPVMAQQGYEFRQGDENLFQREIFDYKNFADKLANPFTAFGYSARNEPTPKGLNVSNPNRNNFDMIADVFNPFAWAQYAENSKRDFEEGEVLSGSLNALGAIPIIPAWLSRAKIGELPKMINKLINPKGSTAIKDQVKKYSGNTPRNLDDITPVKGVKPPHVIKKPKTGGPTDDVIPDGFNLQTPLQQLAAGADSFRATIQKRLNDLKPGSEGFERLVEAEAKYLQSVGQPYNKVFAERNALARYNELVSAKGNTINDNALAMWKDAIGDPKHVNHNIARELFKNNDGLYYNAWFQNAPRTAVYQTGDFVPKKYKDPVTGLEMPFADDYYKKYLADPNMVINLKRLGKESIPGKVTTGMKYSNNAPVEVHEINHLLQAGRKMPLDDYARKLTPSPNLSKTGKAQWDYFKEGSSGQEPTSYLAELRQSMLDRGIIKNIYDDITPNKLIQAEVSFANKPRGFYDYGWDRGGKNSGFLSNTRVLDLYEKTAKNREILSRALNKLPAAIPVVGASTALSQEQDGGTTPSRSQIIVSEDEQNKKNNQVLGLTNIIDYMVESRGGNEKTWTDLADNIAFHESGPQQRMNPLARQITKDGEKDGLGRGMFQFEPESFDTAKTRYKNVAEAAGKKTGIKYTLNENILNAESALDLSAKDQYTLFFANLIESPAVLKDYADGKLSMADVWLKGHKNVSKKGNRKSFANSMEAAKKELGKTGFLQFSLEDLLPYKKGGESDMLDTYKNYINGKVKSQEANNIYDKLNRIHLNDARRMGMSVPNYIMTHL